MALAGFFIDDADQLPKVLSKSTRKAVVINEDGFYCLPV